MLLHLDPVVGSAVDYLKTGEISQPLSSKKGWYLVKVISKRQVANSTASQRKQIKRLIFQRKLNQELVTFLSQLRSAAYIKILL